VDVSIVEFDLLGEKIQILFSNMFSVFDKYPRKFPLLVFSGLGSQTQNKVISRKETTGRISIDASMTTEHREQY
jgi:hypothetical protein